jgi:proteasome assembly chaperone (PAC2) family protein
MQRMYKRRFADLDESSLKAPVAVVGLPGIANVGKAAIETLVHVLNAEHVMDFFSNDFPPRVIVQKGIARIPKSTIHLYRAAPDEPHDVLILTADFQPSSGTGVFEYADFVASELSTLGVREVYSLAAYEQGYGEYFESYPAPPRMYVSASSEALLKRISALRGSVPTEEGMVVGANGIVPAWASSMYDMESACLLGETLGIIKVDYRAAKELLESIANLIGLKAHFDVIDTEISKVVEFIEWAKQEIAARGEADDGDRPRDSYIG